jgi:ABC-type dipeptide/oligopeptide/nickel transport system ATPase component
MLVIEHLSVEYYRRGKIIPAVQDISLTLEAGQTLGLVGESGSGKSTVALAILRLIGAREGKITAGRILLEGKDLLALTDEEMRQVRGRRISIVFQDPFTTLDPVMRIREQMAEVLRDMDDGRRAKGEGRVSPIADRLSPVDLLEEALERVQLDPQRILNAYPHQLSGGQRQRVLIASAILTRPQFLLADEPTTALDVLVQKEILDLLFRLQRDMQMGVLLISHNLGLVAEYTQRIVVMKQGRLVEEGTPQELFSHPKDPYTHELIAAVPRLTKEPR